VQKRATAQTYFGLPAKSCAAVVFHHFAAFLSPCLDLISRAPFRYFSCSAFTAGRSPGAVPKKLNLFFSAPHDVFASNQSVDAVYLPSREGVLGVMPGASVHPRVRALFIVIRPLWLPNCSARSTRACAVLAYRLSMRKSSLFLCLFSFFVSLADHRVPH
jgi:hypothetical protein